MSVHELLAELETLSYLIFHKIDEASHTVEIFRFRPAAQSRNRLRLKEEAPSYILSVQAVA